MKEGQEICDVPLGGAVGNPGYRATGRPGDRDHQEQIAALICLRDTTEIGTTAGNAGPAGSNRWEIT